MANWKAIKGQILKSGPEWAATIPYQIKSVAIRDACTAVGNAKKKSKRTKTFNKVGFKSRKVKTDSIYIPKSAITTKGVYHTLLGMMKLNEALPPSIEDSRLKVEYDSWYLSVPHRAAVKTSENQRSIVALDPGVRTFQTWYSPDSYGKVGQSDFGRIQRLCYHLDQLISRIARTNGNKKMRLIRASWRIREKIRNLVDEIHHKTALFLCRNFKIILIPTFETQQMVTKLHSRTARAMLAWAHFRFKTFLKHKGAEYGCSVLEVNEAYTSKTCGGCGKLHRIGSKPILKCDCGLAIDRDFNGARNILLRWLTENQPALSDKTWQDQILLANSPGSSPC